MKKGEALDRIVEVMEFVANDMAKIRDSQVDALALAGEQFAAFMKQCEETWENNALVAANNREEEKLMAERRERQRAQWAEDDAERERRREMFAKYSREDSAREKKKGVVNRDEIDAALKVEEAGGDTPSE